MLTSFVNLFKSQEKISEKWVFLILFLFPIAGPVVRHWNSGLFVLLTFTSLYFLFTKKDRKPLYKEEKIYLWVFFLFFCVFIVSSLANGWTHTQTKALGVEVKFLLFIPIYLLIREYDFSKKALLAGILLSIPVIFSFSVYEYFFIWPESSAKVLIGSYSQLFLGPITALSLLMSYHAYKEWIKGKQYYWIIPIYVSMGLFVITFTQARIAYVTIIGGAVVLLFLATKSLKKKIAGIALIILIVLSVYQVDSIQQRVGLAVQNMSNYYKNDDMNLSSKSSLGLRLEVWRSAQYAFKEHPFIGIGNGNYPTFIKKYIDKGLVGQPVSVMGQAHNTFVEALISKGSIGLLLLLMIFYYPVYIAWKNRKQENISFITISTFAAALTLMSLGESMLINKNNGVSYLLFFTAVLFSSLFPKRKTNY